MFIHMAIATEVTNQMISSRNSKRLLVIVLLVVMIMLGGVVLAKGDCKGASCDPHPPQAEACNNGNVDNKAKCQEPAPPPTNNPPPTPPPNPSPTMPPIFSSPTPKPDYHKATSVPFFTPSPIGEAAAPLPTWPNATRFIPTPTCGIPTSDLGPDEVALLIEAVSEGYSIVIVREVLATSSDDIVVISYD